MSKPNFPLMLHVHVKLPVVDRICPHSWKFFTVVENRDKGDSKLNSVGMVPAGVWEVMGSTLVGDSDFFLCPTLMSR